MLAVLGLHGVWWRTGISLTGGNPVVYRFVIGGCKICRPLGDVHIPYHGRLDL